MASQYESAANSGLQAVVIANLQENNPESSAEALEMVELDPGVYTDTRDEVNGRDAADGEDDVDDDHDDSEEAVKETAKELFSLVNSWIRTARKLLKPEKSFDKTGETRQKSSISVHLFRGRLEKMKKSWHIN